MSVTKGCLLSLLLFLHLSHRAVGQQFNTDTFTPKQLKRAAQHAERKRDHYTAIHFYENYISKRNRSKDVALNLANLYRDVRDYVKAYEWYGKVLEFQEKKHPEAWYEKGRVEMSLKKYEEALESFRTFRKVCKSDKFRDQRNLARTLSEGCEMALADSIPSPHTYITHLENGINMAYTESAPMPANEEQFIFASLKSDTVVHFVDSEFVDTSAFKTQFFLAVKKDDEWVYKGSLKGPFNHPEYEVGNGCFDAEGTKFYFSRCRKNWKYKMICHLYVSYFKDGQWSEPEKLPDHINQKNYTTTQPTMGYDPRHGNEVLYFVSDRPGGRGGSDIWYTELRKDDYREPRNCGGRINTEGNEVTPYYHLESNTLYFSSDGHPTYGQLDIFRSFGQKSKWMKNPENMRLPLNSSADDLYFILNIDPKEGFFTSNREGGIVLKNPTCCDDIYAFENDEFRRYKYQAVVLSQEGQNAVAMESGEVEVYLRDRETSDTTYIKSLSISPNGEIEMFVQKDLDYLLIVKSKNHFNTSIRIPKDTGLINENMVDTIRVEKMMDKAIVLKNIYYDFDSWELRPESEVAIDDYLLQILLLNPDIRVEISSHTDNKGGESYNVRLSQKRAESVVAYLKKKGIDRTRLIPKGYGSSQPIAPNTFPDGSDNPDGRQLNRRTEFKVIGSNYHSLKSHR